MRQVEDFCHRRSPEASRSQMRLEIESSGSKITIIERSAPWNDQLGSDWSRQPIAELRYDGRAGTWTLYWPRHTGRWHRYEDLRPRRTSVRSWPRSMPTRTACSGADSRRLPLRTAAWLRGP